MLVARDVCKRFRIPRGRPSTVKEMVMLAARRRLRFDELWAVRDVSLEVNPGEMVGIIGPNGSGKTTLLRILANVLLPTSGTVEVNGKMCALLELTAGLHPELTGEENAYIYGTLLGLSVEQMRRRYDHIVEFAELERFMPAPVKTYSAGMTLRLAFSVAMEVKPDLYVVDEVLGVGDVEFFRKSMNRLQEQRDRGAAMVVASHDMATLRQECSRVVWLEKGQVRLEGEPEQVVGAYLAAHGGAV